MGIAQRCLSLIGREKEELDIAQLSKDFKDVCYRVVNTITENVPWPYSKTFRCHEIARLAVPGLEEKGYNPEFRDGIYKDRSFHTRHSWLVIGPAILDWHNLKVIGGMQVTPYYEVVTGRLKKRRYREKELNISLAPRFDEIARVLYGRTI